MKWSKEEDDYLIRNYSTELKNEILKNLPGRTWAAIMQHSKSVLGIRRIPPLRIRTVNEDDKIFKDLIGNKYNMLTVVSFAGYKINFRTGRADERIRMWNCSCDCGSTPNKPIQETNLKSLNTKSCGCLLKTHLKIQHEKRRDPDAAFKTIYKRYQYSAKENGREFLLTEEEFRKITSSECFYCGILPSKIETKNEVSDLKQSEFSWNGIDRIDSDLGYILENCNSCCTTCNIAKRNNTVENFKIWVNRISKHLEKTNWGY